jgi:gluconolactonase
MRMLIFVLVLFIAGCKTSTMKSIGIIDRTDPSLDSLIDKDAKIEIIAEGHDWTEGPVWIESQKMLLFSDIPPNKIFKWTEEAGEELYLMPSGYTGTTARTGEPGSNGLILDKDGRLVLCQHGDRRMAIMNAPIGQPAAKFTTIADNYMGKRLNSPNDAVYASDGDLFFTDPPYGLEKNVDDSAKEIPFQGVYRVAANGEVHLLEDSITRPNGIAFTPDEKSLIVANSDPDKAIWYMFDLGPNDSLTNKRIFHDATPNTKNEKGLPDGLKIDASGNIFATGPGGVWIFNKNGTQIGKIRIPEACSNVALADNDKTLYITADMYVLRVKLRK